MKRLSAIIFLAALSLSIKPALADDASARVLAAKVIDLVSNKDMMRSNLEAMMNGNIENMQHHGLPQEGVDAVRAAISKWYDAEINFNDIQPKIVDIYVKNFSEDDLKQLLAFYQSPIGQKAIKTMPTVMREGAMVTQDYTNTKIPTLKTEVMTILSKYRDQMEAAGAAGAGAGGAPAPGAGGPPPAGN